MSMVDTAILISAIGSSLSAGLLIGMARYVYRIDRRTQRNHETLHDTANGPGIKSRVREHRRTLLQNGFLNNHETTSDD